MDRVNGSSEPFYYLSDRVPMTMEQFADRVGVTLPRLQATVDGLVRDHFMVMDSEGNYHITPVGEAMVTGFKRAMSH